MERLIDADELTKDLTYDICGLPLHGNHKTNYANIRATILAQPTIDAIEVVRCKDCKWFEMDNTGGAYCNHPTCGLFNGYEPDAFCSYGERKEEKHE